MLHKVGAQTIVWGEDLARQMESIVQFLAESGYRGVETGMRHFDPAAAERYRDLYARYGIAPLGVHSGGKFWDPEQAGSELKRIDETISFASQVGFRYLVISGNPSESVESMKNAARSYGELGRRCRDAGLRLAYHNHNWELENDGAILDVLAGDTSADEVGLVFDTAWAQIAGMSLAEAFRRWGERIAYVHIKDTLGTHFCELGTGELDHDTTFELAGRYGIEWLVVEQDYSSLTPQESMRVNMEYLKKKGVAAL